MLPLGIFSWFGYDLPLRKRLELIADSGFDSTCLWFGEEEELVQKGQADQMPAMVRERGLILENVHASARQCNLLWSESEKDKTIAWQEYQSALSFCYKYHIQILVIHITKGTNPPPQTKGGIQIIRDLVSQAEDNGITIALENTMRPDYLESIFSDIQSPNLGFCYDSSHDYIASEFRGKTLQKWGSLLVTTHLSDNMGINDDHLLPGSGTIDWDNVVKHFPKASYKGTLMLEVNRPEADKGLTADEFLKLGYQKIRQIAEMLGK